MMDIDFSISFDNIARFRVNAFMQRKGIGVVFRLITEKIRTIDELGLPSQIKHIADLQHGLVLVTGPTGCGKSTTLAAIINEINSKYQYHIITIEDPIEYTHENKKSYIEQREVGTHTLSFQNALRASLREDTDIILVGELRDLESISLALTAAETGHLVLATVHTSGAAKSLDRIIDVFPAAQQNQIRTQISETLKAVIWQELIKKADNQGRVASTEILFNNSAIANLIRKGQTFQINSVIETSLKEGMHLMKRSLVSLVKEGIITQETASFYMPKDFEMYES